MESEPEAHASRFIAAARQLFLASETESGQIARPVVIAGGQPLNGIYLNAFRDSCERHALDLVYFEFRTDRPEIGPTNVVVIARAYGRMSTWVDCVPWCSPKSPFFLVSRREETSFVFDGRGLVIAPKMAAMGSQGTERARALLRANAAIITSDQIKKVSDLADFDVSDNTGVPRPNH